MEHHIIVQKTARYHTYGTLSEQTEQIWLVCHGYGQLAKAVLPPFQAFDDQKHYVVAPEALSRFYWNGFSTKAVASWMTSEDRLHEIQDYINYLDQLYQQILAQCIHTPKIHVIGFSQGATTVSRWIGQGKAQPDFLTLWAGQLAHDLDWEKVQKKFQALTQLFIVYGDQDKFVPAEMVSKQQELLKSYAIDSEVIVYDGKHKMEAGVLESLWKKCKQQ